MDWTSPSDPDETLQHLKQNQNLHSLDVSLLDMGDVEAKLIGEAVAAQESLATLTLMLDSEVQNEEKKSSPTSMWPVDSFLTEVFLKPGRESPVRILVIAGSGTDGDVMRLGFLPEVLRDNKKIRELVFQWHGDDGCSREEMQELLGAIVSASLHCFFFF